MGAGTHQVKCPERQVVKPLDDFQLVVGKAEVVQAFAFLQTCDLTDGIVWSVSRLN